MITYEKMLAKVKRQYPKLDEEEQADMAHDWCAEAVYERETFGQEDTPCLENCDDAGTGEGCYHGRM